MKYKFKQIVDREVDLPSFPFYRKSSSLKCLFVMVIAEDKALRIWHSAFGDECAISHQTSINDAFEDHMIECSKKDFWKAFDDVYTSMMSRYWEVNDANSNDGISIPFVEDSLNDLDQLKIRTDESES